MPGPKGAPPKRIPPGMGSCIRLKSRPSPTDVVDAFDAFFEEKEEVNPGSIQIPVKNSHLFSQGGCLLLLLLYDRRSILFYTKLLETFSSFKL